MSPQRTLHRLKKIQERTEKEIKERASELTPRERRLLNECREEKEEGESKEEEI